MKTAFLRHGRIIAVRCGPTPLLGAQDVAAVGAARGQGARMGQEKTAGASAIVARGPGSEALDPPAQEPPELPGHSPIPPVGWVGRKAGRIL